MTPALVLLLLGAALVHASWNAMLRGGADKLWSAAVIAAAGGAAAALCLPVLPHPAPASWPYLLVSTAVASLYMVLLAHAYRWGELGTVYPVARGAAPLLVTLGAWAVAGEAPPPLALFGIALVALALLSLAHGPRGAARPWRAIGLALATGAAIGTYSVSDGIGARLSGNAIAYAVWLNTLIGVAAPLLLLAPRGFRRGAEVWRPALAGVLSVAGYALVVWAMTRGALGAVSALRETSVVFAAFIGRFWLGERLGPRRLAACLAIAAGVLCIAAAR